MSQSNSTRQFTAFNLNTVNDNSLYCLLHPTAPDGPQDIVTGRISFVKVGTVGAEAQFFHDEEPRQWLTDLGDRLDESGKQFTADWPAKIQSRDPGTVHKEWVDGQKSLIHSEIETYNHNKEATQLEIVILPTFNSLKALKHHGCKLIFLDPSLRDY